MNLSTILHLFQRSTAILLILTTAVFGTPLPLFAQAPAPVPTNETGNVVPTVTLEQAEEEGIKPGEEPPASEEEPLELSVQQSDSPLSSVTDEPEVAFQLRTSATEQKEKKDRTERSSVVDENGNTVETRLNYRNDALRKTIEKIYNATGELIKQIREKYTKDGEIHSQSIVTWDAEGHKLSQDNFFFKYHKDKDEVADELVYTLRDWVDGKQQKEKIVIEFDNDGNPTTATQTLTDGTKKVYDNLELVISGSANAKALAVSLSDTPTPPVSTAGQLVLWSYTAPDGATQSVVVRTGQLIVPATDALITEAQQILGDQVVSGTTTPADSNVEGSTDVTKFFDADGNPLGQVVSSEPPTWYTYTDGEYVEIPQEEPVVTEPVVPEEPVSGMPAYKSEARAIALAATQFPDVAPETIAAVSTQTFTKDDPMDLTDGTILPENFVAVHLVTLQIGKGGPTLTYIGGYDSVTNTSIAVATQATLDYLEKMDKSVTDLPAGTLETIADYLNIDPSNISNATYTKKVDAVFCKGTGCASWTGSLEVTATVDGVEKYFTGTITGGFFGQPDRAPTITLSEEGSQPDPTKVFDDQGRLISEIREDGSQALYFYGADGSKTAIELGKDGNILSAVKTHSDGKVETFDHLEKMMISQTTCSADGQQCSSLAASMKYDPNAVQLGYQTVSTVLSDGSKQKTTFMFTGYLAEMKNPDGSTVTHIYGENYDLAVEMSAGGDVTSAVLTDDKNNKLDVTAVYSELEKQGAEGISKLLENLKDLTTRLGMSGLDIKVTNFEQVTWTSGCVGWYSPGQACTKALVTGYSMTFEIEGVSFEYHAGRLDPKMVEILGKVTDLPESEKLAKIKELVAALPVPEAKVKYESASPEQLALAQEILGTQIVRGVKLPIDLNSPSGTNPAYQFYDAKDNLIGSYLVGGHDGINYTHTWYRYISGEAEPGQKAAYGIFDNSVSENPTLIEAAKVLSASVEFGIQILPPPYTSDAQTVTKFYDASYNLLGQHVTGGLMKQDKWYKWENGEYVEISQEPTLVSDGQDFLIASIQALASELQPSFEELVAKLKADNRAFLDNSGIALKGANLDEALLVIDGEAIPRPTDAGELAIYNAFISLINYSLAVTSTVALQDPTPMSEEEAVLLSQTLESLGLSPGLKIAIVNPSADLTGLSVEELTSMLSALTAAGETVAAALANYTEPARLEAIQQEIMNKFRLVTDVEFPINREEVIAGIKAILEPMIRKAVAATVPSMAVEAAMTAAVDLMVQKLNELSDKDLLFIEAMAKDPANADKLVKLIEITEHAKTVSEACVAADPSCPGDAYRHMLWSYALTEAFGVKYAKMVTDAYEDDNIRATGNTDAEHEMDYRNNALARLYASETGTLSDAEILARLQQDPDAILSVEKANALFDGSYTLNIALDPDGNRVFETSTEKPLSLLGV